MEEEGIVPNSLYEASTTLTQKPDKVTTRKNYMLKSLVNIDRKIFPENISKFSNALKESYTMIK